MFRATIKGLFAHKLRMALTAIAVVLGVAFMAGTFVLTDTIKHSFDNLFVQTSSGKDVIVRGALPFGRSTRREAFGGNRPLVPDTVLAAVRSAPGVQVADGIVNGLVTVLDKNGKAIEHQGPPTLAFNWLPDKVLSSLSLRSGRAPTAANEVTIDVGTAKSQHFAVGDQLTVISNAPPKQFMIVGLTGFGKTDNILGATMVTFDTPTAQALVGKPGYFSQIDAHVAPGRDIDQTLSAVGDRLPKGFEADSGASVAQQNSNTISSFINVFNRFLLSFALIALFVGGFLIFNTFSILIGQRTRELALLRAVGASRRQVYVSVLFEALLVGLFGSILGLLIGLPLAQGLYSGLSALGLSLPSTGLQFLPRTAIVSIITGTVITLASAVLPALRAARIPPVAAMREGAVEVETSLHRRAITGGTVLAIGLALLAVGLIGKAGLTAVGSGAALTFVGVAMLAPFVAGPLARLLGRPLPAMLGTPGRLGQENAARNPRRTAATASALMVGLALVAAIATLGSSGLASFKGAFDQGVSANFVLTPSGDGFPVIAEQALKNVPGVTASSPIRTTRWHDGSTSRGLTGIDPVGGPVVFNIKMLSGSTGALAKGELLIDDKAAKSRHLKVGDTVQMGFDATGLKPVVVGGIYKSNPLGFPLGSYTSSAELVSANVNQIQDDAMAIKTASSSTAELAALEQAFRAYPNVKVKTASQFKADQARTLSGILAVVYVLLALSILIALIGVVNTLALSVMERTREIGLLRAVGMQRRQIKRMIRGESVVVSLIGAVLGLALGVGFGAALVASLSSSGFNRLAIPTATIVTVVILTGLFGVGAAVFPARRAAKLDVLAAIATE